MGSRPRPINSICSRKWGGSRCFSRRQSCLSKQIPRRSMTRPCSTPSEMPGQKAVRRWSRRSWKDAHPVPFTRSKTLPAFHGICPRAVDEQVIALDALATIGGPQAAEAVIRLVSERIMEEPGLRDAFAAANALRAWLPANIVSHALDAPEPALSATACLCSSFWPQMMPRVGSFLMTYMSRPQLHLRLSSETWERETPPRVSCG
jgi:hypothetical protein